MHIQEKFRKRIKKELIKYIYICIHIKMIMLEVSKYQYSSSQYHKIIRTQ